MLTREVEGTRAALAPSILPRLGAPPLGFVERRGARGISWLCEPAADALLAAGFGPGSEAEVTPSALGGRAPLGEANVGGRRVLVRRYSHGGLAGKLLGLASGADLVHVFRDGARPFQELGLFARLAAVGVPVPEVAFARATRARWGWTLELGTYALEATPAAPVRDLAAWLAARQAGTVGPRASQRLARASGRLVARLHELGFHHADLQPANLLVVGDPARESPVVYALDLDRSRFRADMSREARVQNLARLWRHLRRRAELGGPATTRADRARFLAAWAAATRRGAKPDAARALWREAWHAIDRRESRARGWHRLGWLLRGAFDRSPQRSASRAGRDERRGA